LFFAIDEKYVYTEKKKKEKGIGFKDELRSFCKT